ncbi:MAG: prepilin-type N-terminal cleavage/methylation domain-containing protein [Myxococcota bacterium]
MSNLIRKSKKGFTLIELMIVVAIIGILAAIAIPNFLRFQLKSKSSEGKVNIAAIRTAEESYLAEFGQYVAAQAIPTTGIPGPTKALFTVPTAGQDFDQLGWAPEGNVFFQYAVAVGSPSSYAISAAADIDDDTTNQAWGYVKPANDTTTPATPVHAECAAAGVGPAQGTVNTVGPCNAVSGQSVF